MEILYESNMLLSYILQLTNYEGYQVNFNQSQKDIIFKTMNLIERVSTAVQTSKATVDISLYTKNIEILVNVQNDVSNIESILELFYNSSSLTENNIEANQIIYIVTNYSTTLQSLGKMRNN